MRFGLNALIFDFLVNPRRSPDARSAAFRKTRLGFGRFAGDRRVAVRFECLVKVTGLRI
jgi:hypothetical protein